MAHEPNFGERKLQLRRAGNRAMVSGGTQKGGGWTARGNRAGGKSIAITPSQRQPFGTSSGERQAVFSNSGIPGPGCLQSLPTRWLGS